MIRLVYIFQTCECLKVCYINKFLHKIWSNIAFSLLLLSCRWVLCRILLVKKIYRLKNATDEWNYTKSNGKYWILNETIKAINFRYTFRRFTNKRASRRSSIHIAFEFFLYSVVVSSSTTVGLSIAISCYLCYGLMHTDFNWRKTTTIQKLKSTYVPILVLNVLLSCQWLRAKFVSRSVYLNQIRIIEILM